MTVEQSNIPSQSIHHAVSDAKETITDAGFAAGLGIFLSTSGVEFINTDHVPLAVGGLLIMSGSIGLGIAVVRGLLGHAELTAARTAQLLTEDQIQGHEDRA